MGEIGSGRRLAAGGAMGRNGLAKLRATALLWHRAGYRQLSPASPETTFFDADLMVVAAPAEWPR